MFPPLALELVSGTCERLLDSTLPTDNQLAEARHHVSRGFWGPVVVPGDGCRAEAFQSRS